MMDRPAGRWQLDLLVRAANASDVPTPFRTASRGAVDGVDRHAVSPRGYQRIAGGTIFPDGMAADGASRPLPWIPAKVALLNRQRPLASADGNAGPCPFAVARCDQG